MYGLLYPGAPIAYFASVRLDRDHSDLGFDQAEVPGGGSTDAGWSEIGRTSSQSFPKSSMNSTQTWSRPASLSTPPDHPWSFIDGPTSL